MGLFSKSILLVLCASLAAPAFTACDFEEKCLPFQEVENPVTGKIDLIVRGDGGRFMVLRQPNIPARVFEDYSGGWAEREIVRDAKSGPVLTAQGLSIFPIRRAEGKRWLLGTMKSAQGAVWAGLAPLEDEESPLPQSKTALEALPGFSLLSQDSEQPGPELGKVKTRPARREMQYYAEFASEESLLLIGPNPPMVNTPMTIFVQKEQDAFRRVEDVEIMTQPDAGIQIYRFGYHGQKAELVLSVDPHRLSGIGPLKPLSATLSLDALPINLRAETQRLDEAMFMKFPGFQGCE